MTSSSRARSLICTCFTSLVLADFFVDFAAFLTADFLVLLGGVVFATTAVGAGVCLVEAARFVVDAGGVLVFGVLTAGVFAAGFFVRFGVFVAGFSISGLFVSLAIISSKDLRMSASVMAFGLLGPTFLVGDSASSRFLDTMDLLLADCFVTRDCLAGPELVLGDDTGLW